MSVVGNKYRMSPAFVGSNQFVANGNQRLYGGGFKDVVTSAWGILKPFLSSALRDKRVHDGIALGASKLGDLLDDKKGKSISAKGQRRLEQLLGEGIKYLK